MLDADSQPLPDDAMRFVGAALKNALQLLKKAISKEAAFLSLCHKYWPQRLSLRPLNTTLLSEMYRRHILSLAKCVEFEAITIEDAGVDNTVVAAHALQILHHLNRTQQGVTLRSVLA